MNSTKAKFSFGQGFILSHPSINVWIWSVFNPFNYKSVTFDCEKMRFTWPNECKLWLESTITVFLTTNKVKFSSLNFISSEYLFTESISLIWLAGRFKSQAIQSVKFSLISYTSWIPVFYGVSTSFSKSGIWLAQILELQKSFEMIPNSNRFPGYWISKIFLLPSSICVGAWVRGQDAANF